MSDQIEKLMHKVSDEITQKRKQINAIRQSYDLARDMLLGVERQLRALEEQYDALSQGQLPLMHDDDKAL